MSSPGLFLTLDGIDGTGKSTQCRLLADWLRARDWQVHECTDPGGTSLGTVLRAQLLEHRHALAMEAEALLFMASRAELVHEVIRPALARGHAIVCDRFTLANVVYQGHGGGLDIDQLWQTGLFATGGLEPDLTLVLDVPVELAVARRHQPADRIESRDLAFHERVRAGFLTEAQRRPGIRVVDATRAVEVVHQEIVEEVARVVAARARA